MPKFERMTNVRPGYKLDLIDQPIQIKSPAGYSEKETNERFDKSLDLFHIGQNFEEEGQEEKALDFYTETLKVNPFMSLALLRRAKLKILRNEYQEALQDLFSYRNQQPNCSRGLLYLARVSGELYRQTKDDFHRNNSKRYLDWAVLKNQHYRIFIPSEN